MVKNAFAYITRKKNRAIIIFIILNIVLSCLFSCLSILKSSNKLEKSLYKASNSSIQLTKKDGGYFEIDKFKKLEKIGGIEKRIYQYEGFIKPTKARVVEGEQKISVDYQPENLKNLMALEATNNTKGNPLFTSGVFSLVKGRHIASGDLGKIMVHEDFAKKNNLQVNDKIGLKSLSTDNSTLNKEYQYEIVGIFSGKKQEKYTGLTSDFSENMVFMDYRSSQKGLGLSGEKGLVNKITLYSDDPSNTGDLLKKIKALDLDWSAYQLEKDSKAFDESLESVAGIKHIIRMMTYLIMVAGVVVLSLILVLWLRERIHEVGIFLSIGIKKIDIVGQFIAELIFVSIPAMFASFLLGSLLVKGMIGSLISPEDISISTDKIFGLVSGSKNIVTFIESYGILLGIIVISVVLASSMILVKKPKEILSKVS